MDIVRFDEFMQKTMGGWPLKMKVAIYSGLPFNCACGKSHLFSGSDSDVMRELGGMRLVVKCPEGKGINCVKVSGFFKHKFDTLFGAKID